jgi:hypothetical protein
MRREEGRNEEGGGRSARKIGQGTKKPASHQILFTPHSPLLSPHFTLHSSLSTPLSSLHSPLSTPLSSIH